MARIEKTIFISYRRADVYTALAVYENLKNQGYDVFFDYRSISSGDFEQIITSNIRARAHFLLILTPTALDRCNEPGDWLRREIELAIDEKRNIIPLFFKGFRFGDPSVTEKLTGTLKNLGRYNGLNVHEDYFDEAMRRLRTQYLNIPLSTVLHPVSTEVQNVVRAEQIAADKALEQIEDVRELVKHADEKPARPEVESPLRPARKFPPPARAGQNASVIASPRTLPDLKSITSKLNLRVIGLVTGVILVVIIVVLAIRSNIFPPKLGIGSTMVSEKDGMTLVYIPAGEFTMGSNEGESDEQPVHTVQLDAFWIDQTEVTNAMYSKCVNAGACNSPTSTSSWTRDNYYGNSEFDNYPVIYVSWNDAKAYCEWADRRLPTEAEWEKAASWNDASQEKYTYPWGNDAPTNDLLNYKSEVGDTTRVGNYPEGASPYGALDMAGNVWEWVSSLYQPYPYDAEDGRENLNSSDGAARRLRGGSWIYDVDEARSANRGSNDPASTVNDIGFRCALSENEPVQSAPLAQAATNTPPFVQTSQPVKTSTPSLPTETPIPPTPTLGIGSTMTGKDGMTLLYVPAGEFTMGSDEGGDNEKPAHLVYLDAYWIDRTEVTNKMYSLCVDAGVCQEPTNTRSYTRASYYGNTEFDNYPVTYVDWIRAEIYCEWTNRRLPTEAEWEKAARGENAIVYPWGNDFDGARVNFCDRNCPFDWADKSFNDGFADTAPVGSYPNGASPYGALDMAGNVLEWVSSLYRPYPYDSTDGRENHDSSTEGILRGGMWSQNSQNGIDVRSAARFWVFNTNSYDLSGFGFRCAMSATP